MSFNNECPKIITIMADYGFAYAWDEDGAGTGLAEYFPEIPEIALIEAELDQWSRWFSQVEEFDPLFPWDEFHLKGLALAHRLYQAIKHTDVPVFYWPPFEDPQRKEKEKIAITGLFDNFQERR